MNDMAPTPTRPRGEFILLGVFALFLASYLVDVYRLPMDAKILPYVLAPPLIVLLLVCAVKAALPRGKAQDKGLPPLAGGESAAPGKSADEPLPAEAGPGPLGLGRTITMGLVLFGCIFLFGFYFGSGLMLLIWFAFFKRLNVTTLIITVATPLVLYASFELLMSVGLYPGLLIELLQR
jgi:hypothetical protein